MNANEMVSLIDQMTPAVSGSRIASFENYGPRTAFGQRLHSTKYRAPEERYDDYAVRYARAVSDNERMFRRVLKYVRDQSLLPAGRQQHSMGRPYLTTAYNCVGRDTLVLTREHGVVEIETLAGTVATIVDGNGTWQKAEFAAFGERELHTVTFTNGRKRLDILATADHDWIVQGERRRTSSLRRNDRVDFLGRPKIDWDHSEYARGVVHGLVYGDGTRTCDTFGFHLRLCGSVDDLRPYLNDFPSSNPPSYSGDTVFYFFGRNAWTDLKALPDPVAASSVYLLGFLRGWFAADGCVSMQPEVTLCTGLAEEAWLRRFGPLVGFNVIGASALSKETNYGIRSKLSRNVRLDRRFLTKDDFLLTHHRERFEADVVTQWRIARVSDDPVIRDEVFCAIVPTTHSFALAGGIHTGNCFVSGDIPDSYEGIMENLKLGGMTLRTGGGVGWDFSTLRPSGEPIRGLGHGSFASGPISFMRVYDVNCETILTAGHRRGAMMAVLRIDHPDILSFIGSKRATGQLKNFNISVAVTDKFMEALANDGLYDLEFKGARFATVRATDVWAKIMESNWDWAEPGVLFIDRINARNPLYYCESISATNPCAEQPLPPWGACLLGSVNLVKMLTPSRIGNAVEIEEIHGYGTSVLPFQQRIVDQRASVYDIDYELLDDVVDVAVRAFDNVPERTVFPLEQQRLEAINKRRMGVGVTGMANAIEIMGFKYGSLAYIEAQDRILERIALQAYRTSVTLAQEKGAFPLFDADKYLDGYFVKTVLDDEIRDGIAKHGLRNGLLLSIAPTGTISMAADNVSSGIEPPYAIKAKYDIIMPEGKVTFDTVDHAFEFFGVTCQTANETTAEQHIDVLCAAQKFVDSSISKTCNVDGQVAGKGQGVTFSDFKQLYQRAYDGGAKGCTTFNKNGKLLGVRHETVEVREADTVCTINEFGQKSCAADL